MKPRLWLIFAAVASIASAALLRPQPEPPVQPVPIEPLPDVHVEHEYVTVPVAATRDALVATGRTPTARMRSTSMRPASVAITDGDVEDRAASPGSRSRTVSHASTRDQTLFEKARRAFMGDGRHRPEPFPRPRDN
jgi:hypothetical protein